MQVLRSYIDGAWLDPADEQTIKLVDPATEKAIAAVPRGSAVEVDRAVAAARKAFPAFSATTPAARIALLKAVQAIYARREEDLAQAVCSEIGAPYPLTSKRFLESIGKTLCLAA